MCYSAQIKSDYLKFLRKTGATMSKREFFEVFWRRGAEGKLNIPKAIEALFADPKTEDDRKIKALIDEFHTAESTRLEQELFKQKKRLADAERKLLTKTTIAATESKRIAADKIERALRNLADLRRTEPKDRDSRFYPGWYAPVLIVEDGQRVVKLMRYRCRPAGKPSSSPPTPPSSRGTS